MVKLRGPLLSFEARGWMGGYFYQTHFVNPCPYPIALLGRIREPYFMPAWGLKPYASFISQYYSPTGWIYEMRRTWHGMQPTARRAQWPIKQAVDRGDPYQKRYADAVSAWQGMDQATKDIYNKMRYPVRCSGYNRFIKQYIENTALSGSIIGVNTYYFDASDTPIVDFSNVWTDEEYVFDGRLDTYGYTSTIGSFFSYYLEAGGVSNPISDSEITQVRARARSIDTYGAWSVLTKPTGGWTWEKLKTLDVVTFESTGGGIRTSQSRIFTKGRAQSLGTAIIIFGAGAGFVYISIIELEVTSEAKGGSIMTEDIEYIIQEEGGKILREQ